jgi:hypothetical protein
MRKICGRDVFAEFQLSVFCCVAPITANDITRTLYAEQETLELMFKNQFVFMKYQLAFLLFSSNL